jgi:hypothetical protein
MEYIRDLNGAIILSADDFYLYYAYDEDMNVADLYATEICQFAESKNGGLKLNTILDFQEELGFVFNRSTVLHDIKEKFSFLIPAILSIELAESLMNSRLVLTEKEGCGPGSSYTDYLYLIVENDSLTVCSSRKGALSASEIIEYYGLGENEYWDQIQVNGEFIEQCFSQITSPQVFCDTVNAILTSDQWMMKPDEVDWKSIVEVLLLNTCTTQLGIELKLLINFNLN